VPPYETRKVDLFQSSAFGQDALRLWPNPARSGALVQVEIALPEGFEPDGPLRVTVVSSSGQLVAEEALRGTTGQLPTNKYAPGLYHMH
jgi:hypothetical protein